MQLGLFCGTILLTYHIKTKIKKQLVWDAYSVTSYSIKPVAVCGAFVFAEINIVSENPEPEIPINLVVGEGEEESTQ